jgi:hypothetical protein
MIVAVLGMAQPAASSGASGIDTVMGATMEPPAGMAGGAKPQVAGGPGKQTQPGGKSVMVAAGGITSVKVMKPPNGEGPSLKISIS